MNITSIDNSDLSSVIFIHDYIQFVFKGSKENIILSAFTLPSTVIRNHKYNFQSVGWRDALCTLINKKVKTAIVEKEKAITLTFENGDVLEISLKDEDYVGPEAAQLTAENGKIIVW